MGGGGYKVLSFKALKKKEKNGEAHALLLRIAAQVSHSDHHHHHHHHHHYYHRHHHDRPSTSLCLAVQLYVGGAYHAEVQVERGDLGRVHAQE